MEFTNIAGVKLQSRRRYVLFDSLELGSAGDWNDPRFLCKQPRESQLSRGHVLPCSEACNRIHQCTIRLPSSRREPGKAAAIVFFIEGRIFSHGAGEVSLSKWAEGNKSDAQFLKQRKNLFLWALPPKRVLVLQGSHRLNCMRTANGLSPCFRKSKVLDLTLLDQFLSGTCNIFNRHSRIDTMLIQEVNPISTKSFE